MSYPITPNPAIHDEPPQAQAQEQAETQQALQGLGQNLIQAVVQSVLSIISGGLLGGTGTSSSTAAGSLGTIFTNIFMVLGIGGSGSNLLTDLSDPGLSINTFWTNIINDIITPLGLIGGSLQPLIDGVLGGTGNLLSSLISYLTGTNSTASTAYTNATTALTNAGTALSQFGSLLSGMAAGSVSALVSLLTGTASTATSAASTASTANTNASTANTSITTLLTNAVNSLTGLVNTVWTQADLNAALASSAKTTAANSAAIAALQAQQAQAVNGGMAVSVNFSGYANSTSLPAMFTTTYYLGGPVTLGITSGCAALQWPNTTTVPSQAYAIYNVAPTTTDYQLISATFPTGPSPIYATFTGFNFLIGRSNSAGTSYVFAALGYNTVELGCVVGGTQTIFTSTSYAFNAGATYSLVCGTSGGARVFQVLCNGAVILPWTDTSTSQLGSGFRYGGFGDYGYNQSGFTGTPGTVIGANIPGTMSAWYLADNTPAAILGSGMNAYRSLTATVAMSTGNQQVPASLYDTVRYITSDLTWTPTTSSVTIKNAGWYMYKVAFKFSSALAAAASWPLLYVNGTLAQASAGAAGGGSFNTVSGAYDTFVIYNNAGDVVKPGCANTVAPSLVGETTGTQTYFAAARLSPG